MSNRNPPLPAPEKGFARCACQHCAGLIDFALAGFTFGQKTDCPICGQSTILTIVKPDEIQRFKTRLAQEITKPAPLVIKQHLEDRMDRTADNIFLFACLLAAVIVISGLVGGLSVTQSANNSWGITLIIFAGLNAVFLIVAAIIAESVIKGIAEIIRSQ